jgi:proline iminopeptidase
MMSSFKDFIGLTKEISRPVLILSGEHDHAIGPEHYESFDFKEREICVLDCGHHPYVEKPLDFQEAILKFVK